MFHHPRKSRCRVVRNSVNTGPSRSSPQISTGFAESAVNEIIAKRMAKKQQMRWNRYTVQRFLDVRVCVLNGILEDAFRHWHRGFRPAPTLAHGAVSA